jgi:hypothetical protein
LVKLNVKADPIIASKMAKQFAALLAIRIDGKAAERQLKTMATWQDGKFSWLKPSGRGNLLAIWQRTLPPNSHCQQSGRRFYAYGCDFESEGGYGKDHPHAPPRSGV